MGYISFFKLGFIFFFILGVLGFVLGLNFLISGYMLFFDWEIMNINSVNMVMTVYFDWMSVIFVSGVFLISSMVFLYSEGYMEASLYSSRFYFLVFFFIMSMMLMIISPNLMSILIGWDGLGLTSYCLVIFFQNYKSYNAGMLTILTNRLGDVAILIAIAWAINFGSWHYIFYMTIWGDWSSLLCLLLIFAGFTKSAQIPFSSWLPAAMAAPTPVSSLVHSSTLVTAGVYLLIRFSNMLNYVDCSVFLFLSVMTMFMSGLGANFEFDMSKIIALSTLSHLGLMMSILFLGHSVLAFFHLFMHAFFSALLFLCAGQIIHCMGDTQDIRQMGGIVNWMPFTCSSFLVSSFSMCGLPFMSGFYSKDMILESVLFFSFNGFVMLMFYMSVGLTVAYTMRMVFYCLSSNMNFYVACNFREDNYMMKSMVFLVIMSVFMGSVLGWLIFGGIELLILPLGFSVFPLILIILCGYLSYTLVYFKGSFFSIYWFIGLMWFLPFFSSKVSYNFVYSLSKNLDSVSDSGWGEYLISSSVYMIFSNFSGIFLKYHYNNLKLFMFIFLLFMVMFII